MNIKLLILLIMSISLISCKKESHERIIDIDFNILGLQKAHFIKEGKGYLLIITNDSVRINTPLIENGVIKNIHPRASNYFFAELKSEPLFEPGIYSEVSDEKRCIVKNMEFRTVKYLYNSGNKAVYFKHGFIKIFKNRETFEIQFVNLRTGRGMIPAILLNGEYKGPVEILN